MTEEKGIGKKLLGLFVVDEDEAGSKPPEEDTEIGPVQSRGSSPPPAPTDKRAGLSGDRRPPSTPPTRSTSGPVPRGTSGSAPILPRIADESMSDLSAIDGSDFSSVYTAAGIAVDQTQRIEKAQQLLATLPQETPAATKRQIVSASLTTFGIPVDQIAFDGSLQIKALDAYVTSRAAALEKKLTAHNEKIASLNHEIETLKQRMADELSEQQDIAAKVTSEKSRIQSVLDFFSGK